MLQNFQLLKLSEVNKKYTSLSQQVRKLCFWKMSARNKNSQRFVAKPTKPQ